MKSDSVRRFLPWSRSPSPPTDLTFEPEFELEPVGARDFVICGVPRSGTTLLAAMLFQPPAVLTVNEPWDGMRMAPAELFARLREGLTRTGKLHGSRLDHASLLGRGRVRWAAQARPVRVEASPGTLLGVKWPAYWRLLGRLPTARFLVCVRHPCAVVGSYERSGGRLALGLEYDIPFHRTMNRELESATTDLRVRRALLYERVARQVLRFAEDERVRLVRFERWFEDPQAQREEIARFLGVDLGPGPAMLSRPPERPVDPTQLEAIRSHCPSALALGYRIPDPGGHDPLP